MLNDCYAKGSGNSQHWGTVKESFLSCYATGEPFTVGGTKRESVRVMRINESGDITTSFGGYRKAVKEKYPEFDELVGEIEILFNHGYMVTELMEDLGA